MNTECINEYLLTGFAAFMVTDSKLDNDEEKDYPSNLLELLQAAIDRDSTYHHLALLSLNTVIWNLDVCVYLLNSLNFQVHTTCNGKVVIPVCNNKYNFLGSAIRFSKRQHDCD